MGRGHRWLSTALLLGLGACGPEEDVELLALPPAERPSPEARLGIPEIAGVWSFAGWEIVEGDSTSLDRTFPSFGELQFATQRLDSIAGTFVLGGTPVPIVGDVRRDGHVTFVTVAAGGAGRFVAGTYQQDTLWLELASVLPADEWPRDARAAFVRETPSVPAFAWLRGARVVEVPPPTPLDSLAPDTSGIIGGAGGIAPAAPQGQGGMRPEAGPGQIRPTPPVTRSPSAQPPAAQPQEPRRNQPGAQPAVNQPSQPPAQQPSQPPVQQPVQQPENEPVDPTPEPAPPAQPPATPPQPAPAEPPAENPAPLLGEPIDQ